MEATITIEKYGKAQVFKWDSYTNAYLKHAYHDDLHGAFLDEDGKWYLAYYGDMGCGLDTIDDVSFDTPEEACHEVYDHFT